ncbi:MAG: hypothetical protein V1859_03850 [archaeon]
MNKKELLFLIVYLLAFFALFVIAYIDWEHNVLFVSIGIPSKIMSPIIMVLCLASIGKVVYHIISHPGN